MLIDIVVTQNTKREDSECEYFCQFLVTRHKKKKKKKDLGAFNASQGWRAWYSYTAKASTDKDGNTIYSGINKPGVTGVLDTEDYKVIRKPITVIKKDGKQGTGMITEFKNKAYTLKKGEEHLTEDKLKEIL